MSAGIFISYRRDDTRHAAGRLLDHLRRKYDAHQLFMDVDSVAPGQDFVRVLFEALASCDVMLVIIGPRWLNARDKKGAHRLDNPRDFVRLEVEAALARDMHVIPVLVDGATLPSADALPPSMRGLARRQAVRLAHERFGSDANGLVGELLRLTRKSTEKPKGERSNLRGTTPTTSPSAYLPPAAGYTKNGFFDNSKSIFTAVGVDLKGLFIGFFVYCVIVLVVFVAYVSIFGLFPGLELVVYASIAVITFIFLLILLLSTSSVDKDQAVIISVVCSVTWFATLMTTVSGLALAGWLPNPVLALVNLMLNLAGYVLSTWYLALKPFLQKSYL